MAVKKYNLGEVVGKAATITVGEITTLPAGSNVQIENVGTENNAILNFSIPEGRQSTVNITYHQHLYELSIPAGSGSLIFESDLPRDEIPLNVYPTNVQSVWTNDLVYSLSFNPSPSGSGSTVGLLYKNTSSSPIDISFRLQTVTLG